jgi:rhodanese-related sulfurtransferase
MRSLDACGFLAQLGFPRLYNLSGGMSEYASHRARAKA